MCHYRDSSSIFGKMLRYVTIFLSKSRPHIEIVILIQVMLKGVMFVLYPHPVSYMLNNYIAIHNYREMKYVHEEAELFNSNTVEK